MRKIDSQKEMAFKLYHSFADNWSRDRRSAFMKVDKVYEAWNLPRRG